jgi:hypothetical protein
MNPTDRFEAFLYTHEPEAGWSSHDEAWEAWEWFEQELFEEEKRRIRSMRIAAFNN